MTELLTGSGVAERRATASQRASSRGRGPGAPTPLVLLPGTLCDRRVFDPLIARLQQVEPSREIVGLPTWGSPATGALAAAALAAAPENFALLGFSLGGIVALEMASQAPDRIAGLALVATNARPVSMEARAGRRASLDAARAMGARGYVESRLWPTYVSAGALGDGELKGLIGRMAEALGLDVLADQVAAAHGRADSRPRLASIQAPTLLLCGEDDGLCTVEMHREMAQALPDASLSIVPQAGHFVVLEAPDRAAAAVATWLARVDAARSSEPGHSKDVWKPND